MKIVTLNVQEIEIDAIQAVDAITLTYKEFKRIRNDDEEVLRLIKLDGPKMESIHIMNLERKIE